VERETVTTKVARRGELRRRVRFTRFDFSSQSLTMLTCAHRRSQSEIPDILSNAINNNGVTFSFFSLNFYFMKERK